MLTGTPVLAPDGLKALDTNTVLTPQKLADFHRIGYRAAIRYVRRAPRHDYDISAKEAEVILAAGFALGIVQHVAPEGWIPTAELGTNYGRTAALESQLVGLPPGVNVWCDLEGVKPGTPAPQVVGFLNNWWTEVAHLGYLPGLYVGWRPGLTGSQLYRALRFQYYWAAFNLNADEYPTPRGVCMQQNVEQTLGTIRFDPDSCKTDAMGNKATFLAGDGWPEL